ncbi:MAG: hypothetical protein ACRD5R_03070 [Candidatus Acidiferrales bacterium]
MRKVTMLLAFLFATSLISIPSFAQDSNGSSGAQQSATKTVTGCLQKGTKPDTYSLAASDGTTYWLHSDSVKLSEHVGHTVTVTGREGQEKSNESTDQSSMNNQTPKQSAMASQEAKTAHLWVTDLTMVSDSCTPK